MLAARLVQEFDFTEPHLTKRLSFDDGDWDVGRRVEVSSPGREGRVNIVDLDGRTKSIIHPGNASDHGKRSSSTGLCANESMAAKVVQVFRA